MATLLSGLGGAAGFGEQSFKTTTLTGGNLDDGFKQVDITSVFGASGINLYGTNYTTMFIGTNGLITFGGGITSYTPGALTGLGRPSITPQWTDIDITKGGDIYWDLDPATGKVTITWSNVASYSSTGTDSFQVVLTNAGSGNFGIDFNYGAIGFTNGGSGVAVAGISNGTTTQTLLPGSGNAALLTGYPNVDFLTNDPAGVFSLGYVGGQPSFIDGTVDGTAGNNLIDSTFVDSNGDRIDNNDATGFGGTTGNDDYVRAGDGNDTVISGVGNDIVFGGNGADSVQAGTGNDILYGEAGNDTLDGGADNDTLIGGGGADSLIGGAGIDLADYSASTLGVTVNLGLGTGLLGDAAGDTLSGIENVTGSNTGADILTGDGNANVLTGLIGADSLDGGLGNDTLDGGADNDTLIGGGGADSLIGGAGIDLADYTASTLGVTVNLGLGTGLLGDAAGDTLSGIENVTGSNTGADILTGDGNANVLTGLVGADSLDGGLGNDTLDGGADNDTLIGGGGADSLIGGAGIDLADYSASTLGVTVNLGLGTGLLGDAAGDTLSGIENVTGSNTGADILTGDGNANVLTGLVGADSLDGGLGNDTLDGGADNDTLIGGGGADSLIGGAGIDLADYSASTLGVTVNLSLGTGLLGDAAGDTLSGIENVTGSNTGADILTGDGNANVLTGLVGADSLSGGLGNDTLDGGADNDTLIGGGGADGLIGGAGIDLADYTASTLGVTVNLGLGTGLLGDAAGDTLSGIENVTGSNTGADILTGDGNANVLTGLVGADSLSGGLGNDTLDGGADNDTLIGGGGADSLIGGAGIDLADYSASTLGVTVNLGLGTGLLGDAAGDTLSGIENVTGSNTGADILTGDGNANVLTGLVGADSLDGGLGNDTLDGGADNDTLIGGGGADSLIGGAGIDLADYSASTLGVTVNLSLGAGLLGDAAGDTLSGIENVTGSAQADVLTGDGNANVLTGGAGNDTLSGGAGNDTLIGGSGSDVFIGDVGDVVDGSESVLDNDELNLKAYGKAQTTITFSDASHENGSVQFFDSFGAPLGTMTFSNIEKVIPCFTPGSIIRTERGEKAVETLRVGDKVLTMDHGLQTIRWIGRRTLAPDELRANPTYCPILLPQGAFGAAGPVRDIMLSPQHRILMTGARAEMLFGEPEVLVAAMHLVGHHGVVQMRPDSITYIHLLFDRHEIIWADGMWTESFQPGDATLGGMDLPQRTEILSLFPELAARSDCFPAARTTLKRYEAKVLLAA